jgi:L-lactate dehydrogenase (cytochrome)
MYCHTKRGHIIRQLRTTRSVCIPVSYGFLGLSIFAAHAENARAFSRFFFLPRVLRPVGDCDPTTTILGYPSSLPIFVSGAALAKLGHPLGEINITIGVHTSPQNYLIQMVSSNASLPFHEIAKATHPGQTLFFQLYKPHDNIQAEQRVRAVEEAGYKAIFLTVDAIVAGRRERDIRSPWVLEDEERGFSPVHSEEGEVGSALEAELNSLGTAGALIADNDRNMTWEKVRQYNGYFGQYQHPLRQYHG